MNRTPTKEEHLAWVLELHELHAKGDHHGHSCQYDSDIRCEVCIIHEQLTAERERCEEVEQRLATSQELANVYAGDLAAERARSAVLQAENELAREGMRLAIEELDNESLGFTNRSIKLRDIYAAIED
jgi:hypothetical protein